TGLRVAGRAHGPRGGLAVLPPLLRDDLRPAPLHAVPDAGILPDAGAADARRRAPAARAARRQARGRGLLPDRPGGAVRSLLGHDGAPPIPALRTVLLPRHRVLHRPRRVALRGRSAGRAQALARTGAGGHAVGALAARRTVRRRGGTLPGTGTRGNRLLPRRAGRAHALPPRRDRDHARIAFRARRRSPRR